MQKKFVSLLIVLSLIFTSQAALALSGVGEISFDGYDNIGVNRAVGGGASYDEYEFTADYTGEDIILFPDENGIIHWESYILRSVASEVYLQFVPLNAFGGGNGFISPVSFCYGTSNNAIRIGHGDGQIAQVNHGPLRNMWVRFVVSMDVFAKTVTYDLYHGSGERFGGGERAFLSAPASDNAYNAAYEDFSQGVKLWIRTGASVVTLRNYEKTPVYSVNPVQRGDNKDFYVGPAEIFGDLQAVLNSSDLLPGDRVYVEGDFTYSRPGISGRDAFSIKTNGVSLIGVPRNGKLPELKPVAQMSQSNSTKSVIAIDASDVLLENLIIDGEGGRGRFHENIWYNNSYRGVFFSSGDRLTIRACTVLGNYQGIHCTGANGDLTVEYCDIYQNGHDGYGHNLYLGSKEGAVARIQYNYIHRTIGMNNNGLKSRFWRNEVYYNYFYDLDQAMELIGNSGGTDLRDSDVVGNVIYKCNHGIRLGGDGSNSGTRGRYRLVNNTYYADSGGDARGIRPMRTFSALESVEAYNNVILNTNNPSHTVFIDAGASWVSGVRIAGTNNWVTGYDNQYLLNNQYQGTLIDTGGDPASTAGFTDYNNGDFTLTGDSPLLDKGVSVETLENWGLWPAVPGREGQDYFPNPLTTLYSNPVTPFKMTLDGNSFGYIENRPDLLKATVKGRKFKENPDLGAYGEAEDVPYIAGISVVTSGGTGTAGDPFKGILAVALSKSQARLRALDITGANLYNGPDFMDGIDEIWVKCGDSAMVSAYNQDKEPNEKIELTTAYFVYNGLYYEVLLEREINYGDTSGHGNSFPSLSDAICILRVVAGHEIKIDVLASKVATFDSQGPPGLSDAIAILRHVAGHDIVFGK